MWIKNNDTNKWSLSEDVLDKTTYDYLKEDLKKVRLYSKCLSGSTYLPINNLDNLYDILTYQNKQNWYVNSIGSPYSVSLVPSQFDTPITATTSNEYFDKFLPEYGLTLKNLFTPTKLINDSINNYIEVDVVTTDELTNIGQVDKMLTIDGIRLKEGHRVLVKNQRTFVTLSTMIDPDNYFISNYYEFDRTPTSVTYYIFNEQNGIYKYTNSKLVREPDLDIYTDIIRYSIVAKLGLTNRDKQYHLSRLKSGYFPLVSNNEPIEFIEKHNWVLRNRVDYNNILDINYYDIIKHAPQSISWNSVTYSIPERSISVGEFGVIINNQGWNPFTGITSSNIITNKFKSNLRSIDEAGGYYWICGDSGTLLKVNKVNFDIELIDLGEIKNYKSISFFNNLRGMLVGEFNTIYYTLDGGYNWIKLTIPDFDAYIYNVVLFDKIDTAYIGGNNGLFLELNYTNDEWIIYRKNISKILDSDDEYILVEDINDLYSATFSSWGLTYSTAGGSGILPYKEGLFIVSNNSNVILHDLNNFIPEYEFIYLDLGSIGDVKTITTRPGTNNVYLSADSEIATFDITQFTLVATSSNLLTATISTYFSLYSYPANSIIDFESNELLIAGNNSLLDNYLYAGSFLPLDPTFGNNLRSKMLFLDYDIASKLNFFDDSQNYRVPNSVTFSVGTFSVNSYSTETNWLDYYKDSEKTFKYYTYLDNANIVQFSTTFSQTTSLNSISFTSSSITTSYNDVINLAPNVASSTQSRYLSGATAISAPSSTYNMYLYRYLMIIGLSSSIPVSIGDIIRVENQSVLSSNFLINNIQTFGSNNYLYLYTDFNETIIKQLQSSTYSTSVTNLNKFNSTSNLIDQFNLHPVGYGYGLTYGTTSSIIEVGALFNNKTAYYNMQSDINAMSITYSMVYQQSFLDFGYKPTYNLYDYLNNIDSNKFGVIKEFLALPKYAGIPVGALTSSTAFIEYNYNTNKIKLGSNFSIEWQSLLLNTFVDVIVYQPGSTTTERLLIIDKYIDDSDGSYVIAFHKKIDMTLFTPISAVDILSRNGIQQISDDLQLLNEIQRTNITKNVQLSYTFDNLENEINFKFPTDSYAKALLADVDIKESLSSIIYTDYKGELSMNITRLDREFQIPTILTNNFGGYLQIICSEKHGLSVGEGFVFELTGATGTSTVLNPQYSGYSTVTFVINDYIFVTSTLFGVYTSSDPGYVKYVRKDPFFNYQPVDIFDLGIDLKTKRAVEIKPQNYDLVGNEYQLINLDLTKYKYQLVDGIALDTISNKYSWLLEAEISDAVIGEDSNGLVWYKGRWNCGRWFGGTWLSGEWISGDWYDGIWKSVHVEYSLLKAKVDNSLSNNTNSKWYNGRWFNGSWNAGTWYNGRWYGGTWSVGNWYNGIWNDGIWNDGDYSGGVWVLGTWNTGTFSCNNKPAYWLDGTWYGGDFDNGIWYNGTFGEKKGNKSRFGVNASNSRTAIWKSGKWLSGEFHSRLNLNNNIPDVSDTHKYSVWYTGSWNTGDWYGGIAYNIDFRSGEWHGGILEDIQVIGINTSDNTLQLNGEFRFNIGDEIWIIDNNVGNTYSVMGSNSNPRKFRIADTFIGITDTTLVINYDLSSIATINVSNINTGLRIVSRFTRSTWDSGIWTNGIFDGGKYNGGIWYNGIFDGNWGN